MGTVEPAYSIVAIVIVILRVIEVRVEKGQKIPFVVEEIVGALRSRKFSQYKSTPFLFNLSPPDMNAAFFHRRPTPNWFRISFRYF